MKAHWLLISFILMLETSIGAQEARNCRSVLGRSARLIKEDYYSQVYFGLSDGPLIWHVKRSDGFEVIVVKGAGYKNSIESQRLIDQYLERDLLIHYKERLKVPPILLRSIHEASQQFMENMSLVLVGKTNVDGTFKVYGGTAFYASNTGVDGLPFIKELKDMGGKVKLPDRYPDSLVVEIGRLAMLRNVDLAPEVKRELFVFMQGVGKRLLQNELKLEKKLILLSFTTAVHDRFYSQLGVQLKSLAPVWVPFDTKARDISEIEIQSLPE